MLHQQNKPTLKLSVLGSAQNLHCGGGKKTKKNCPSREKHLAITLKTWQLWNNSAILCMITHWWMHWSPAKNQANSRPCLLKNEVIWPVRDMLKYWIGWDGRMTCGTTAFHRDAQPSSKSRLNRAHLQASLEKPAMKWHDSTHVLPTWNITVLSFKKTKTNRKSLWHLTEHKHNISQNSTCKIQTTTNTAWQIKHYSWSQAR